MSVMLCLQWFQSEMKNTTNEISLFPDDTQTIEFCDFLYLFYFLIGEPQWILLAPLFFFSLPSFVICFPFLFISISLFRRKGGYEFQIRIPFLINFKTSIMKGKSVFFSSQMYSSEIFPHRVGPHWRFYADIAEFADSQPYLINWQNVNFESLQFWVDKQRFWIRSVSDHFTV